MSVTKTVCQKFRLRTKLVVPFVMQIVAAAGLVGYLSFHSSQKAIAILAGVVNFLPHPSPPLGKGRE